MLEYVAAHSGERTEKIEETRLLILHGIDSKLYNVKQSRVEKHTTKEETRKREKRNPKIRKFLRFFLLFLPLFLFQLTEGTQHWSEFDEMLSPDEILGVQR